MKPNAALALLPLLLALPASGMAAAAQEGAGSGTKQVIRFGDPDELAYREAFFPGADYDPAVPTPDGVLGQLHGTRLSRHAEVLECFRRLEEASPRVTLHEYGRTHEGRMLAYAAVTSPENHARLAAIRADLARLADPRGLEPAEAQRILNRAVPVAWMGYSIHGDELSGTDAAVALGYHLAADTRAATGALLESMVVVIDPCMNPDGRERILGMVEQSAGYTPNLDYASMHRGRWPWGRGNHYLFDLNRDWMAGTQPETQARWRAVRSFQPQLFVDAHEMGSLDTYLFYPQAEPINPAFQERHVEWQNAFAAGIAAAFDRRGWSYYTREWADGWAPFYSDAWASLAGAIGILYEQARTAGSPIRRASGEVLTYRQSVHHQAVASLANLETLAERRAELLANWAANRRRNVDPATPGNGRVFVARRGANGARERELLRILVGQGVEVQRTLADGEGRAAEGALGEREDSIAIPAGSLLVPAMQPERQMVRAYLDFDPRLDREALQREREELERKASSKIYDVTAWSLAHALGLDAWWIDALELPTEAVELAPPAAFGIAGERPGEPPAAFVVSGDDDGSVAFAARAMELGVALHVSDRGFTTARRSFPRGSLLVRRVENPGEPGELSARLARAAEAAGVVVHATYTGRSPDEGPDLGGGHFHLLARPRAALLANAPVAPDRYGHLWHHLDRVLGVPFTILDAAMFGAHDLRRYNVLVLPPGGNFGHVLEAHKERLAAWIESGGTLIACEGAAALLTSERLGLSSVALRRDVLDDLEKYAVAAKRQRAAREVAIDETLVWTGRPAPTEATEGANGAEEESGERKNDVVKEPEDSPESLDEWRRRFSPYGVTLLAHASPESWITAGCPERMAVPFSGSHVFLTTEPVAVRLGEYDELRLGGLLWPEARERIAESAYLTVERKGSGQLILFAAMPAHRGHHHATARLFSNAVVFGPGLGASQPIGW